MIRNIVYKWKSKCNTPHQTTNHHDYKQPNGQICSNNATIYTDAYLLIIIIRSNNTKILNGELALLAGTFSDTENDRMQDPRTIGAKGSSK